MSRRRRSNPIVGAFVAHRKEMRESPAWRALPDDARRVLDRLELEHMRHGGAENGKLICTYQDFQAAGLRRASIPRALRQCSELGFLEIKRCGYRPQKVHKAPNAFRLTYVNGCGESLPPTDDWQSVRTDEEAAFALKAAEAAPPEERVKAVHLNGYTPENIDSRPAREPCL